MCGIVGFYGPDDVVQDIVIGLTALQHRGQDAAGIATFDDNFHLHKGNGLINDVFKPKQLKKLKGNIGIGHARYTTQGSNDTELAQPFTTSYPFGLSMVHNGNVINFRQVAKLMHQKYHVLPKTSNDLELIMYTFASELRLKNLDALSVVDIFDAVETTQELVKGAYATITIIAGHGLLAFNDPLGIRPLVMGRRDTPRGPVYAFASESTCFDYLGFDFIKNVGPGQAIFIDSDFKVHYKNPYQQPKNFCVFEHIYFAREDSTIHGRLVARERVRLGKILARKVIESGIQPDMVIDVPSSGYFAASGLAEAIGVPYRRALVKNNHMGRSFIVSSQAGREDVVKKKLNPIREFVEGKKVAVVDDSIVRGTTSRRIVRILREAGAKEVYFISSAPPIVSPCIYGIDMAMSTELIAANYTEEEICRYIEADKVIYQSLDDLKELFSEEKGHGGSCFACFTGNYPTGDVTKYLRHIQEERQSHRKKEPAEALTSVSAKAPEPTEH
ncbi:amidophosphoribosyltransferase [Hymenobacter sp. BT186]|uniref:Amidophosphoribosyltransferase n=1 Tax=Hymenobacter telluris TaxID=2816474 RepID=A0A939ET96_9BACT|nr:amidophosphoribosyltransferase [Hymenobacter telluris]MBO0356896.1 amidophosphoribosyltransferase [Hymenobacter telluris]MBW3372923.1 amidophosphoribosyltransferase [Hymenobacter norwichensis]